MNDDDLLRAVAEFGTPMYLYDRFAIRARVAELSAALPAGARVLYSLKANPLVGLLQQVRESGCGAEVSSAGELDAAVRAGFDPDGVLYTGPAKSSGEITAAVAEGARLFSAESAVELGRLEQVAAATGARLRVLLRLQPTTGPTSGLTMADGRQFGFEPPDAVEALRTVREHLDVDGFHVYSGSQIAGVDELAASFDVARRVVEQVSDASGIVPRVVDLGGGFPWPYAERGAGAGLDGLRERLEAILSGWAHGPEVWFETGRRLTASAGHLLTTVVDRKHRADGSVIVVLDAGINVLGGMSGLGRVMRPRAALDNLSRPAADVPAVTADVVGPLCTPLDRIAVRAEIADPRIGDVLRVPNAGAYGLTASLVAFLGRPAPLEIVTDDAEPVGVWRTATRAEPVVAPPRTR